MSKRDSLRRMLWAASIVGISGAVAQAAPTDAPYRIVLDSLAPAHYFPLDEAAFSPENTLLTHLGTAAPVSTEAKYFRVGTGLNWNDDPFVPDAQGSGINSQAHVGATVGPVYGMSKFTSPENTGNTSIGSLIPSQAAYLNQLAGFKPNLADPATAYADPNSANFNRVFEGNLRGALQLNNAPLPGGPGSAYGNGAFTGDAVTGAFTVAGWFRMDNGNTSSTIRIFESGGDNAANGKHFQITTGGSAGLSISTGATAADTRSLKAFYPSGKMASTVGGDRGIGDSGQWYFLVASTSGNTSAERIANLQVWERYADKTNAMGTAGTSHGNSSGHLGVAKFGYRDLVGGFAGPNQGASDKMDELAIWNRVLQYDERESMYVTATTPTGGAPLNTSSVDGVWNNGGNWSQGIWPLQHGGNNLPYFATVIDHNINTAATDLGAGGTDTFRSNVFSLIVNPGKSLTLHNGTVIRSAQDMTINGNVVLNGDNGVFSTTSGAKDFNVAKSSALDGGRNVTLSNATQVTFASPSNKITAEGNLTISLGTQLTVNPGTNLPAAGSKVYVLAQADSNQGSGTALQEAGVLNGKFTTTLNQPVGDPLQRRFGMLYENRSANGVGVVDTVKLVHALPGDSDIDNDVDINDALQLTNFYGAVGTSNWRTADFTNDSNVDINDALDLVNNYGGTYATTLGTLGDNNLTLVYDFTTGIISIDSPGNPFKAKSLNILSASGAFNTNVAYWLNGNAPAAGVTFIGNTPLQQSFGTLSALGGSFFGENGEVIGAILDPGLTEAFLLNDLTITYGIEGQVGTFTADLAVIPEPGTIGLLLAGGLGLSVHMLRRRRVMKQA